MHCTQSLRTLLTRRAPLVLFALWPHARSAHANAPDGRYEVTDDVVVDTVTALRWQRDGSDSSLTHEEAIAYCQDLDLAGEKGFRLPTIRELHTLVDETRSAPAIDVSAFINTSSQSYWTSTRVSGFPTTVWAVSFRNGFDFWFEATSKQEVRCVRLPSQASTPSEPPEGGTDTAAQQ